MKNYNVTDLRTRIKSAFPFGIVPAHTEAGHFYTREDSGRTAASVTTKLGLVSKGYLHKWYASQAVEHIKANIGRINAGDNSVYDEAKSAGESNRDNASDIGTTAHGAVDLFLSEWIKTGKRLRS